MKKIITALLLIVVSVAAFAQKKRTKINRHLTVDAEEVLIPNFTVKDHNGKAIPFEKPRVWKFKNGTAVKWGNKTRGHRGRHKLIDETIDSTAEPVVIPPVEQEPQPIPIPMPEQAVVGLEALSAGGGNPNVLCVVDYDIYLGLGSNVQNCISYVLEGMASIQPSIDAVAGLKAVGYTMIIKEIIVNTTPSRYSQMPSNASMMLIHNEFGVDFCHRWDVDGKILFTRRSSAGSIASSGFGSRVWNLAIIGGSLYWLGTPNYNTKYALGHEAVGHWLTAPHAFECQPWPDGSIKRIDSTYSSTGPNCSRTTKRPTVPTTLMGYAVYGTLDPECKFHFASAAQMVSYWNSYRMNIPLGTAPTCQFTTGPWSEWSGGYRSRPVTATPSNCRGIAPVCLERQSPVVNPPCTFSLTYGPCINGFQSITPTALNQPCTGNYTGPTSQVCPGATNSFSITGDPYTVGGFTRADTAKAIDGNEATRFLTTGATTLTWNFSVPTTRTQVYMSSGFQGGSPNQTLTLTVDGVPVDLGYVPNVKLTKAINATGKRFVLTTTGTGNISRVFEIQLK